MITETLLNSLKSLFSSLGAKTTDNNYAVGLLDKTSGEPKGMMGMSDLASVLGVGTLKYKTATGNNGGVQTITVSRSNCILFVESSKDGNSCGLYVDGVALHEQDFYSLTLSNNNHTYTFTPNTTLSGVLRYIEI